MANVTQNFKKGDEKDPGNYRLISLTSVVHELIKNFMRQNRELQEVLAIR